MKKNILILLFGFLSIGININQCGDTESFLTSPVYNPDNNYDVYALILNMNKGSGCSSSTYVFVRKENEYEYLRDAIVTINDKLLTTEPDTSYFSPAPIYSSDSILYNDKTEYSLEVTHTGELIASGEAIMPGIPEITNIDSGYVHSLNKSLKIKWKTVESATSLEVLTHRFSSGLLKPTATEYTIPDTVFNKNGEYTISIVAYNGINPDYDLNGYEVEFLDKGYNIKGATGIFVVANVFSKRKCVIINDSSGFKKSQKKTNDFSLEIESLVRKRITTYLKEKI